MVVGVTSLSPGTMPLYAAKEKGLFEGEGSAVELAVFRSGTENAQAILANEVHIGIGKFGSQTDYPTRHTLRHFGIEPIKDTVLTAGAIKEKVGVADLADATFIEPFAKRGK